MRNGSDDRVTVFANAETCGIVQDAVSKAGLDDVIRVKHHPYVPAGYLFARGRMTGWELIAGSYAGVGVLLAPGFSEQP